MIINIISPHASYYLGGMEIVTIQMAKFFALNGNTVRFFTRHVPSESDVFKHLKSLASEKLEIVEIDLPVDCALADGTWPKFYEMSRVFGLAAEPHYHRYLDADFFTTHLSIDSLFIPSRAKTILHLHGTPSETDAMMSTAMKIPIATIAHSRSIKKWWQSNFPSVSPAIFQNGIDTDFYSGDVSAERDIDVLYVGRFLIHKGIDDILSAVNANHRVVIAGNGPYLPELRHRVSELGLTGAVTFYDTPSTETIRQLYCRAKVFACPSRGREGLLTTLLEAGASGCAILTTSGSGMTDLVQNGHNGIVIEPYDSTSLTTMLEKLLSDDTYRKSLAIKIQTQIRSQWSWSKRIQTLQEIYHENL